MGLPETWTSMGAVSMRRRGVCRARRLGRPVVSVHASPGHGRARVRMRMAARRSADLFQARLESSKNVPATTPLTRHETVTISTRPPKRSPVSTARGSKAAALIGTALFTLFI
jgi:hypothetical protein